MRVERLGTGDREQGTEIRDQVTEDRGQVTGIRNQGIREEWSLES